MTDTKKAIVKINTLSFEHKDRITAKLYCRTKDDKKICLHDSDVLDYVIVDIHDKKVSDIEKKFEKEKYYSDLKFKKLDYQIHDNDANLLKIYSPTIAITNEVIKHIEKLKLDYYEHDLPFLKKYMLEKQLKFYKTYEVEFADMNLNSNMDIAGDLASIKECLHSKSDDLESAKEIEKNRIKAKTLYFDIETLDDGKGIDYEKNPILMIGVICGDYKKVLLAKSFDAGSHGVVYEGEGEMLQAFSDLINELKPDIIAGYNIKGFDIPYILSRCRIHHVKLDIGDNFSTVKESKTKAMYDFEGMIVYDQFQLMRYLMRFTVEDSLSLDNVSHTLLGEKKHEVNFLELAKLWLSDDRGDAIKSYVKYCLRDVELCKMLDDYFEFDLEEFEKMLNVDMGELSYISSSQTVENYLIENSHNFNQVVPNRPDDDSVRDRTSRRIQGAFVLDPKPGFYKNIVVFDFTSLYPTIISSHNITKGTIKLKKEKDCIEVPDMHYYLKQASEGEKNKAFIPSVIEDIVLRRIKIKKEIKKANDIEGRILKSRLQTYKIMANSIYGYLAFYMARWYSFEAAETVTSFGRYHIKHVISEFEKEGIEVIYSDTDSIFALMNNTTSEKVDHIVDSVNKSLPGIMHLEKEDVFSRGIFVGQRGASEKGAKKKYALLSKSGKFKIAGMAMVRGDWSDVAKNIQEKVIEMILKDEDVDGAAKYVKNEVRNLNKRKPSDFIISTKLKKPVSEYASRGPHVVVAQKMIDNGEVVRPGSIIEYIICVGTSKTIGDRAKLPGEADKIDFDYYINNQIIPVVDSIFDVFDVDIKTEANKKDSSLSSFF